MESKHVKQPDRCPVCAVVRPAECRNEFGNKIWPPHWARQDIAGGTR